MSNNMNLEKRGCGLNTSEGARAFGVHQAAGATEHREEEPMTHFTQTCHSSDVEDRPHTPLFRRRASGSATPAPPQVLETITEMGQRNPVKVVETGMLRQPYRWECDACLIRSRAFASYETAEAEASKHSARPFHKRRARGAAA